MSSDPEYQPKRSVLKTVIEGLGAAALFALAAYIAYEYGKLW